MIEFALGRCLKEQAVRTWDAFCGSNSWWKQPHLSTHFQQTDDEPPRTMSCVKLHSSTNMKFVLFCIIGSRESSQTSISLSMCPAKHVTIKESHCLHMAISQCESSRSMLRCSTHNIVSALAASQVENGHCYQCFGANYHIWA
jgi:hypothetical protein